MVSPYSPLKVYVAARWDDRDKAIEVKKLLEQRGLIVTSTWLTPHDEQSMDALKKSQDVVGSARQRAIKDFEDINRSDILLLLSLEAGFRNGTGGKHVETGYALGTGVPVVVLGKRENVFHYHPAVRLVDCVEAFLRLMEIPLAIEGGEGTTQ